MGDEINEETTSFLFGQATQALEQQVKEIETLESRALQILIASSVVVGSTLAISINVVSRITLQAHNSYWALIFLGIALLFYYFSIMSFIVQTRPVAHYSSLSVNALWSRYRHKGVSRIEEELIEILGKAYEHNEAVQSRKDTAVYYASVFAGGEAVFAILSLSVVVHDLFLQTFLQS